MMYCKNCGGVIRDEEAFCKRCGTAKYKEPQNADKSAVKAVEKPRHEMATEHPCAPTKKICAVCGDVLISGARFCATCGEPITQKSELRNTAPPNDSDNISSNSVYVDAENANTTDESEVIYLAEPPRDDPVDAPWEADDLDEDESEWTDDELLEEDQPEPKPKKRVSKIVFLIVLVVLVAVVGASAFLISQCALCEAL